MSIHLTCLTSITCPAFCVDLQSVYIIGQQKRGRTGTPWTHAGRSDDGRDAGVSRLSVCAEDSEVGVSENRGLLTYYLVSLS